MFNFIVQLLQSIFTIVLAKLKDVIFTLLLLKKEDAIYKRQLNLKSAVPGAFYELSASHFLQVYASF